MPIIDIQARFRELGRIRTGILERPEKGKPRPRKLATFRLTSPWRHLLDELSAVFAGEVQEWTGAPGEGRQWELVTESDALDVVVPPGDVLSQWYELWSGGGCQRRCDGVRQTLGTDRACQCPEDPRERAELAAENPPRACKPTTRLIVMLPQAGDLGVWRLESHGFNAAVELAGAAGLVELATKRGIMVPAVLRLEQRSVKRPGEPVKRFAVPALSFRGNLGQTLDALGFARGDLPILPSAEARPALDVGGTPALPAPAAAHVPPPDELTNLETFGDKTPTEPATLPDEERPAPRDFEPPAHDESASEATDRDGERASLSWTQMAAMRAGEAGLGDDERHGIYLALTGGRTAKGAELTGLERNLAMATFVRIKRCEAILANGESEAGPVWAIVGKGTGVEYASAPLGDAVDLTVTAGPAELVGRTRRFARPAAQSAQDGSSGQSVPEAADTTERAT